MNTPRTCPPCNHNCRQSDDCPARVPAEFPLSTRWLAVAVLCVLAAVLVSGVA